MERSLIVATRQNQPFRKVSDLTCVYGIGEETIKLIKDYIQPLPDDLEDKKPVTHGFVPDRTTQQENKKKQPHTVLVGGMLKDSSSSSENGSDAPSVYQMNNFVLQTTVI